MPASNIVTTQLLRTVTEEQEVADATFNVFFIAEGYSDENQFLNDCKTALNRLVLLAPFNLLATQAVLGVHAAYEPTPGAGSIQIGTQAYDPTTTTTTLGGYFQSGGGSNGRGKLHLDYGKLTEVLQRVRVWSTTQSVYLPLALPADATPGTPIYQHLPGVIIVLLPAVWEGQGQQNIPPNTGTYSGLTASELFEVELEHDPQVAEPLCYWATSANAGYERVVARAVALGLGLGDESEQITGPPPLIVGKGLDNYPNLCYTPTAAEVTKQLAAPKWQGIATRPLTLHTKPTAALDEQSSEVVDNQIDYWEGGGGYSQGVYRPAHDCILRQKPGVGTLLLKLSEHPFCPVCRAYLRKAITGECATSYAADEVTLATQRSEYRRVFWLVNTPVQQATTFTVGVGDESVTGTQYVVNSDRTEGLAFWGYTCQLSETQGFYLENVRVHQSKYYDSQRDFAAYISAATDYRDVLSSISFTDLLVTFDDAAQTTFTFDVAACIKRKDFSFRRSSHGSVGCDKLYQSGVCLQLVEQRPGWPRLEVELSVVFRSTACDFDPGGAAQALKCYPQIQFRWVPTADSTLRVKEFLGNVRLVCNAKHYMFDPTSQAASRFVPMHHTMSMGGMPMTSATDSNDVSCFTDSNLSARYMPLHYKSLGRGNFNTLMRRKSIEYYPPVNKPTWAALFDYYYPHAATADKPTKVFVGVYNKDTPTRHAKIRKLYVAHPIESGATPVNDDIFITKFARQGAYDNIHVNGDMGKHRGFAGDSRIDAADIQNEDIVAAPFCGQDCFHLHWRWSLFSDTTANTIARPVGIVPAPFRGWGDTQAHAVVGAPLIPPNQQLRIGLHYLTANQKQVDYEARVSQPAPYQNQVIMEQGTGWAMIYAPEPLVTAVESSLLLAPPIPHNILDGAGNLSENDEENFIKIYDFIRFHHSYSPANALLRPDLETAFTADTMKIHNHVQVPTGADIPTMTWPSGDYFVDHYRRDGDYYNPGLYVQKQLVVDSSHQPDLATTSIEAL